MGLDLIEYVIAVEQAFGLEVPDEAYADVRTVRQLGALVAARVGARGRGPCLTQRAFHRVRRSLVQHAGASRAAVRPTTAVVDLLPADGPARDATWAGVRGALGPDIRLPGRPVGHTGWRRRLGGAPTTVGGLAREIVARDPAALREPGAPWTEAEIAAVLLCLLERECGVDVARRGPGVVDAEFVRDLGLG